MTPLQVSYTDVTLLKLAREIAMDIHPLETILANHNVTIEDFDRIRTLPRFQQYLEGEMVAWGSALNTHERVKLKSAAVMETWLPELYARMHDRNENLNAKVEAGKLVAKLAGMGIEKASINGEGGERFSVTINLGEDKNIRIEKDITPKVIEGSVGED
jgi:hypothetical protein